MLSTNTTQLLLAVQQKTHLRRSPK
ncbi:unnamed protein product [Cuscuta epithymum]|uniref:Uncharacterized protein n=1 Tax=Cuscuta epithymum TaxID=186058 RepID=A0AAV0CH65_9ASTE|nr:unnamed protein product [Cuscuta epithymum]CAH9075258.1 unnamed protein product [Cuscuta epithymum]